MFYLQFFPCILYLSHRIIYNYVFNYYYFFLKLLTMNSLLLNLYASKSNLSPRKKFLCIFTHSPKQKRSYPCYAAEPKNTMLWFDPIELEPTRAFWSFECKSKKQANIQQIVMSVFRPPVSFSHRLVSSCSSLDSHTPSSRFFFHEALEILSITCIFPKPWKVHKLQRSKSSKSAFLSLHRERERDLFFISPCFRSVRAMQHWSER